jgi:hypothetical protein
MKESQKCHDPGARNGCTGADSNVLVAGSPMGEANVIPRRCTLARVVLSFQSTISILSLGLLMTLFSGCVLPVGPRFEDPPTTQNIPPYITSTRPLQGTVVTAVGKTGHFSVSFNDVNADPLYVRWLAEYPQSSSNTPYLLGDFPFGTNGQPNYLPSDEDVGCLNALALNTTLHNITVLVSDQPFWNRADPDAPTDPLVVLTQNKPNSVMAQANWVLNVQCP